MVGVRAVAGAEAVVAARSSRSPGDRPADDAASAAPPVLVSTVCALKAGSNIASNAATTTGKYSGWHPAMTALTAAFSSETPAPRAGIIPIRTAGRRRRRRRASPRRAPASAGRSAGRRSSRSEELLLDVRLLEVSVSAHRAHLYMPVRSRASSLSTCPARSARSAASSGSGARERLELPPRERDDPAHHARPVEHGRPSRRRRAPPEPLDLLAPVGSATRPAPRGWRAARPAPAPARGRTGSSTAGSTSSRAPSRARRRAARASSALTSPGPWRRAIPLVLGACSHSSRASARRPRRACPAMCRVLEDVEVRLAGVVGRGQHRVAGAVELDEPVALLLARARGSVGSSRTQRPSR